MAVVLSAAAAGDLGGESRELQRLVSEGAKVPSALELGLYCLPFSHRDNRLVGVLDEILWQLTVILSAVLGDRVFAVFLLEKHVPGVGDVRQDDLHIGIHPRLSLPGINASLHQGSADFYA